MISWIIASLLSGWIIGFATAKAMNALDRQYNR